MNLKLKKTTAINLISQGIYRKIINSYELYRFFTSLINDVKESDAVKVYYDGKLRLSFSLQILLFSKQKIFR